MRVHALKSARLEAKLTQAELARQLGVDQSVISRFEIGEIRRLDDDVADRAVALFPGKLTLTDCLVDTPWRWKHLAKPAQRKGARRAS